MTGGCVILASIDPGNVQSAFMLMGRDKRPQFFDIMDNHELVAALADCNHDPDHLAIEYMHPRGMPTSKEEMDTQFWAGRFVQASHCPWTPIRRSEVKLHLCGVARAKDANIRQALLDRYGGKDAKGKKASPGPLYGIHDDLWSALAIGVTWWETKGTGEYPPAS
jgi:hypothetical protein